MASDRTTRASDADRDQTAEFLRDNHVAGRLTLEEFNERLDKAMSARTLGELDDLKVDLPAVDLRPSPPASGPMIGQGSAPVRGQGSWPDSRGYGRLSPAWRASFGSWIGVSLVCFLIWALTGGGSPWFLWVLLPGALLLGRWVTGAPARGDYQRRRDRRRYRDY